MEADLKRNPRKLVLVLQCSYLLHLEYQSTTYLPFWFVLFIGDPASDPNVEGDPYKTIFIGRIVSLNHDSILGYSV